MQEAAVNKVASLLWRNVEKYSEEVAKSILSTAGDKGQRKLLLGVEGETGINPQELNIN